MLVVSETVPGGPAHEKLQPGDVLVRVDGELVTTFVPLEAILDRALTLAGADEGSGEASGGKVRVQVERGGTPVELELDCVVF